MANKLSYETQTEGLKHSLAYFGIASTTVALATMGLFITWWVGRLESPFVIFPGVAAGLLLGVIGLVKDSGKRFSLCGLVLNGIVLVLLGYFILLMWSMGPMISPG
jgi:hypothetical protein